MKNVLLLLLLITVFACKDQNNKENEPDKTKEVTTQYVLVKKYVPTDMATWKKNRVDLELAADIQYNDVVYHLSRNSITESSFLSSGIIPVKYASDYRVSIIVKKGIQSNTFGLRLSGSYPDRVDAIFDLDKGIVIKDKASRDFENSKASIEELSDGWYKCTLMAEVAADDIRIIVGATESESDVAGWEGKNQVESDVYIVPSSIILEEVILK